MAPEKKIIPIDPKNDPRRDFTRRFLPWLVTAAMLVVYLMTLNHWVSLFNVNVVAGISGWRWMVDVNAPIYQMATWPLRLLPPVYMPGALNLFSAVCAALTLGLLARSVALLPQDRTDAQQVRERNALALLTLRSAWMPPLLAALLCGLQLTFWELGTNGGSEIFDLLMFAFVIWSLLEYRLDQKEWRLFLSSLVVGAGMAEGETFAGFFPLFVVAIIAVRGFNFFNWPFLRRMTFCGLAGFLLFLALPMWALISGRATGQFGEVLKFSLTPAYEAFKLYGVSLFDFGTYFEDLLLPLFIALVPVLMLSIRWKIGDSSKLGSAVANLMFFSIHAVFFGLCLWLMFDPPFSPRAKGFALTLYYLIALSAGYYAGYVLLVCGRKHPRAGEFLPVWMRLFNLVAVASVWLLGILAVAGLVYKNAPLVGANNDSTLSQFASLMTQSLPRQGAIVLSDSPVPLYLTRAALTREGRSKDYLFLEADSLIYPEYQRYLHREAPEKWPLLVSATNNAPLTAVGMIGVLSLMSSSNDIYYLHPSFGYYFERFYAEPHGLVYKLKELPRDTILPPPPDKDLTAENQIFWSTAEAEDLGAVEDTLAPPLPNAPKTFTQKVLARLDVPHEQNYNAKLVGTFCSRSLDFFGVRLQRSGDLTDAAACFRSALKLNPDNIIAQINLGFNQDLGAGKHPFVDMSTTTSEHLGKFDSISEAMKEGGPFDEPNFCFDYGFSLANDYLFYRQAAEQFERVHQLDPGYLPARLWLAKIYSINRLPERVIEVLRAPLDQPQKFSMEPDDYELANIMAATAYFETKNQAEGSRLFEKLISSNPTNDALIVRIARVYMRNGMFPNALAVADRRLDALPNNPQWLLIKGYSDNQLKKYDDAIAALNGVLAAQKDNSEARLQRADAYLGDNNLDAARVDYVTLQQLNTNSYPVAYGLGEVAWRRHETNEIIRNFEIYLSNAPTNAPEYQTAVDELRELKPTAGGQ